MKKFIFFTLWNVEKLERYLEEQAKNGYILEEIKHNYWFYLKKASKKNLNYFLTYSILKGPSMVECCDAFLLANHHAKRVKAKTCHYFMYVTKDSKDELALLYEVRMDFFKSLFLKYTVASLILFIILSGAILADIFLSSIDHNIIQYMFVFLSLVTSFCLFVYYFYGYLKQKKKCKDYEYNKHK